MKLHSLVLMVVLTAVSYTYSQNFWEKTAGPDTATTNSLAVNSNGDIFAATSDGVFRSTDNGDTWFNLGINKAIRLVFIGPNEDVIITTSQQGPIFCSDDNGFSWTPIGCTSWQTSIAINSDGDIFAGTANIGMYRTSDNGNNWIQINQGLFNTHINSLIINSNQEIFAGTMFGGVFRSTDNGENWIQMNQGLTSNYITSFAINSTGDIFAGASGQDVFRSTNNGENWVEINQGLTHTEGYYIHSLAINSYGDIFAGTADGVFQSTDNGDNWVQFNQGLINLGVLSLGINSDNKIFAGTPEGIFRSTNDSTFTKNISSFDLYQNYPNPFNPATRISWQSPVGSWQTLKIYDVLGNEVATLVAEYKEVGRYEINFDASGLSSGIYLYRIQAGQGYAETKKMTLLK